MLDTTGGLHAGELVVLSGHPGVGKSTLATSIACHAATHDATVLWLSLGETVNHTTERMLCHRTRVQQPRLRAGELQRTDMTNLTYAAAEISRWALEIEDAVDLSAAAIRERARNWRETDRERRALIVVDYLQLVADDCDHTAVLRSLLATAKETKSSLLLVSQHLANAHARATLESIATAVLYLRADTQTHEIVLAKHRHCQTPQIEEVVFDGSTFTAVPAPDIEAAG